VPTVTSASACQELDKTLAQGMASRRPRHLVGNVYPETPAAKAASSAGDVITQYAAARKEDSKFRMMVGSTPSARQYPWSYCVDGKEKPSTSARRTPRRGRGVASAPSPRPPARVGIP